MKRPDRLVKSGINFAFNQMLFDTFKEILKELADDLVQSDLNLQFNDVLALSIDDPDEAHQT